MQGILIGIAVVAMLAGAIFYNRLRRNMAGVIGVGGSYLVLIGVMMAVGCIGQMIHGGGIMSEVVMGIIFMVIGLGYMAYVMLVRCTGVKQRILLPFAACLIGLGFAWRFLAAILLHIPMESGKVEKRAVFPGSILSPEGEHFTLENDSGDNATYYCTRTGRRVHFRDVDFDEGYPTGWRQA